MKVEKISGFKIQNKNRNRYFMSKRKRTKRTEIEASEGRATDDLEGEGEEVAESGEGVYLKNWSNTQEKTSEALEKFCKEGWQIVTELGQVAQEGEYEESGVKRREISLAISQIQHPS